jgi:multiple sugar transport system substrate-binding protein
MAGTLPSFRSTGLSRRRIIGFFAVFGSALLSACRAGAPARQAASEPQGTVEAWTVWDGPREQLMQQQIQDFQQLFPKLTVRHVLVTQQEMYDKYTAAIIGGTAPDSIMVHARMLPAMADRGHLQALDDLLKRDQLKPAEIWYDVEWEAQQWEGRAYGLPLATGGGNYVLFYNPAHFREAGLDPARPPTTWQELLATAERLTRREGSGVSRLGFASGGLWPQYHVCNNGRMFSPDRRRVVWNSPEGLDAMQFELELENRLYGGRAGMREALGTSDPVQAFVAGRLSMLNQGIYFAFYQLKQLAPDMPYAAANFPYNGANPQARSLNFSEGGWGYNIPTGAKNVPGAWEWLKYTCIGEGNFKFFLAQGRPSPVKRHNERPEFRQASPYFDVLVYTLYNQAYAGITPVWPDIRAIMTQMVADAGAGKLGPRDALNESAQRAQVLLDQYWSSRRRA